MYAAVHGAFKKQNVILEKDQTVEKYNGSIKSF